jgi:hypothetical protein
MPGPNGGGLAPLPCGMPGPNGGNVSFFPWEIPGPSGGRVSLGPLEIPGPSGGGWELPFPFEDDGSKPSESTDSELAVAPSFALLLIGLAVGAFE